MSTSVKISQLIETPVIGPNDSLPIARGTLETFRTPARQFVSEGLNVGQGPGQLFALKSTVTPTTLQFRTLSAVGENLAIATVGDTVVFSTSGQNPIKTTFVADGSATTWPLIGFNSNNAANYRVDFDGVLQEPFTDYNLSANHIVFTTAPLLSTKIVIVSNNSVRVNEAQPAPNTISPNMLTTGAPLWDNTGTTTVSALSTINNIVTQNIKLNNIIVNSSDSPILRQTGSTIATYHYTYSDQFINSIIQNYQIYHEETITTVGDNSLFRLEADVFGYQITTAGYRGNIGFEVVTPINTIRIYGTDGSSGNSWQGFYYQGNVHRTIFWQSNVLKNTPLTFRLLVAGYDRISTIWTYAGYDSKAFFNISEITA